MSGQCLGVFAGREENDSRSFACGAELRRRQSGGNESQWRRGWRRSHHPFLPLHRAGAPIVLENAIVESHTHQVDDPNFVWSRTARRDVELVEDGVLVAVLRYGECCGRVAQLPNLVADD